MVAVRGLSRSLHGRFGFEPQNTLLVTTSLAMAGYQGDTAEVMRKRMIETIETIPGVTGAGPIDTAPLATGDLPNTRIFRDEVSDFRPGNGVDTPVLMEITPGYFRSAGTTLVAGRDVTWQDDAAAPHVAIVNEALARKLFGSTTAAVGRHFRNREGVRVEVIGVAEQGAYETLTDDQATALFFPEAQSRTANVTLVVRSAVEPATLAGLARARLRALDAGLPIFTQTWPQALNGVLFGPRMAAIALGVLGVMAALLSITGIFGIAAYAVSRRMKELGIRIALGADHRDLLRATLAKPVQLLAIGSLAGLGLGVLAGRVLAFIVYQASPRDPLVMTGVVLVMMLLGLLATWIPARRALAVDPLV